MLRKKLKSRKNPRECLLTLVQKNKKTNAFNNRIKKKCEVLAKAYDASLKEINQLKMNLDFKEYARDFWEQKCRIMKQDYESLEQKYNGIKCDKDALEQSYGKLKQNYYKSLEENNEKIKCEYDSLGQDNDSLLEDYDEFW